MTIETILKGSDPRLRNKSVPMTDLERISFLPALEKDLHDTLKEYSNGVALSAPQIGFLWRVFVIKKSLAKASNIHWTIVNPRWSPKSQPKQMEEGCLSFDKKQFKKSRYPVISVTYYTVQGKEVKKTITNSLIAQIFQHEIDHFEGILLMD